MKNSWHALTVLSLLLLGCVQQPPVAPSATPTPVVIVVTVSVTPTPQATSSPVATASQTPSPTIAVTPAVTPENSAQEELRQTAEKVGSAFNQAISKTLRSNETVSLKPVDDNFFGTYYSGEATYRPENTAVARDYYRLIVRTRVLGDDQFFESFDKAKAINGKEYRFSLTNEGTPSELLKGLVSCKCIQCLKGNYAAFEVSPLFYYDAQSNSEKKIDYDQLFTKIDEACNP